MMKMESRRRQGFVGEGSAPFGQVVKGSLQVSFLAAFFLFAPALIFPLGPLIFVEHLEQQGGAAAAKVLRRDATAPANAPVGIGPAVSVDESHVYYAPRNAPYWSRDWFSFARHFWSSSKASSV
jgi:hypothetical protein